MLSFLLQAVGLFAIVAGGFLIGVGFGVAACGGVLLFVGLAAEDR